MTENLVIPVASVLTMLVVIVGWMARRGLDALEKRIADLEVKSTANMVLASELKERVSVVESRNDSFVEAVKEMKVMLERLRDEIAQLNLVLSKFTPKA